MEPWLGMFTVAGQHLTILNLRIRCQPKKLTCFLTGLFPLPLRLTASARHRRLFSASPRLSLVK
ncbi:hypothetical protein M513_10018 [Trichuris suis]|uniref:Uncharacterized protein n=1 Tax=Trichuris suis TaxID=68888 RepID=A0A085LVT0_9BILA|nr:hypothetical protein M513_10018 [Trichuris suis]